MQVFKLMVALGLLLVSAQHCAMAELCTSDVCEYDWVVRKQLVMTCADLGHVYVADNGTLYYRTMDGKQELPIPEERIPGIILADGYARTAMVVNSQVPGPAIEVYEGATVKINVRNEMSDAAVTVHFHGMFQRGTPYMDGSSMVAQCPIIPHTSFTYTFVAEPAGTHQWHAHHGMERTNGVFGPLIVRKKEGNSQCALANDANVLTLMDWIHEDMATVDLKRMYPGLFPNGFDKPQFTWTRSLDGRLVSEDPFTITINGLGRTTMRDGKVAMIKLPEFRIPMDGTPSCFRIVGAMTERAIQVSIDGLNLTAYATDGNEFDPVEVTSIIVSPGETFDFSVKTTGPGPFWFRAMSLETGQGFHSYTPANLTQTGFAVIRSPSDSSTADPISSSTPCTANQRCVVLACPFPAYPVDQYTDCIHLDQLSNADKSDTPPVFPPQQTEEHFLNFAFANLAINHRRFLTPSAPLLTQFNDSSYVPCQADLCDVQQCNCTHTLDVAYNQSVQLVFTNVGSKAFGMHPVHMHGHSFHVLKIGFGKFNSSGYLYNQTSDISCRADTDCAVAGWNGPPPALNTAHPIRKDTLVVPPYGYAVVRLVTDNPGYWFIHCHMAGHFYYGMGMVLAEAVDKLSSFPVPEGFPKCGNFDGMSPLPGRAAWERLAAGKPH